MDGEDFQTGCLIPAMQAAFSGLLFVVFGSAGALYLDIETRKALLAGFAFGGFASVVVWVSGLRAWRRLTFGEPAPIFEQPTRSRPEPVRVVLSENEGQHTEYIDLPATSDQLITLAQGVLAGGTLSEAAWTGSNGVFTRAEFANLRNELIRRGLANWNNPATPARGVSLTRGGQAAMRTFASMAATSTPTPPTRNMR